jgi:hypothetical protein
MRIPAKDGVFWIQTTALLLILLPPIGLYFSVRGGFQLWTWFLLGLLVLGNMLGMAAS